MPRLLFLVIDLLLLINGDNIYFLNGQDVTGPLPRRA